ncbi:hypothetical protein LWC34_05040 [Kibdelosporangium philippinense]|uniref:Secreted protein n=1 Tax=Kibdelosporangium philippinense TaxID=211113 RepID=A0ABS8Z2L9_9PSEU|nr:hypothetical protein [Kibdelosporangium philippinense]MCE7002194.1 hypothetical protein [Kibdelosporangium philippinense]
MANSLVRRSLAVAGAALFASGLLSGAASAAEAVNGTGVAVQQLRCSTYVETPSRDDDIIAASAGTTCGRRVDVVRVRVHLEKFEDGEWRNVAEGRNRQQDAYQAEAIAEIQCQRGRYRAVSVHFASEGTDTNSERHESEAAQIFCR